MDDGLKKSMHSYYTRKLESGPYGAEYYKQLASDHRDSIVRERKISNAVTALDGQGASAPIAEVLSAVALKARVLLGSIRSMLD